MTRRKRCWRKARSIAERKKSLAAMLANVAELGAAPIEQTIGKASLRDTTIATGVATNKVLELTGRTPALLSVAVILQTPEEGLEMRAVDRKLDEITRLLADSTHENDA